MIYDIRDAADLLLKHRVKDPKADEEARSVAAVVLLRAVLASAQAAGWSVGEPSPGGQWSLYDMSGSRVFLRAGKAKGISVRPAHVSAPEDRPVTEIHVTGIDFDGQAWIAKDGSNAVTVVVQAIVDAIDALAKAAT